MGQGSSSGSATSGTDGGSDSALEQNSFTGLLDELAIFGDELNEEQRHLLFHNGEGLYYDPVTTMWRSPRAEDLVVQEGVVQREALVPMGHNHMMLSADPAIVLCQYVWGGRPGHRDELICRDGNPESEGWLPRYYCLMDYYDPTSIVNTSGVVQERYRFSAFGNRTVMAADFSGRVSSEYAWNFAYKGQFRDVETGYYNYGYRYYSPEIGRWLSRDPVKSETVKNIIINELKIDLLLLAKKKYYLQIYSVSIDELNEFWYTQNTTLNSNDSYGLQTGRESGTGPNDPPGVRCVKMGKCWVSNGKIPVANGCTGVPDSPGGYNFTPACDNHDICYSACDKTQSDCDAAFLRDLLSLCDSYTVPISGDFRGPPPHLQQRKACYQLAHAFHGGVRILGTTFFNDAQNEFCKCA